MCWGGPRNIPRVVVFGQEVQRRVSAIVVPGGLSFEERLWIVRAGSLVSTSRLMCRRVTCHSPVCRPSSAPTRRTIAASSGKIPITRARRLVSLFTARMNQERSAKGWRTLQLWGESQVGDVTYGNLGAREQLEFTVIGDAANCAAKIASMRNLLGEHALLGEQYAAHFPGRFELLDRYERLGVDSSQEIVALREARHGAGDGHVN